MLRVTAIRSTAAHVKAIATNARETDRHELWTGWRHTPLHALTYGLEHSSHVWTGVANLQPFCMVGVVPTSLLLGEGNIWLIGTDAILDHQMAFLRRCRPLLDRMQAAYSRLSNYVAADNLAAVNWLRWLNFKFEEAKPMGPDGTLFHRFEWMRDV
jgi:hypothetical protein